MAPVQFLDELPTSNRTVEQKPEVVEFMTALQQNPGKWAQFPLERKTKPKLGDDYEVARRNGVLYARFTGEGDTVTI
jgi:hypothetical protein